MHLFGNLASATQGFAFCCSNQDCANTIFPFPIRYWHFSLDNEPISIYLRIQQSIGTSILTAAVLECETHSLTVTGQIGKRIECFLRPILSVDCSVHLKLIGKQKTKHFLGVEEACFAQFCYFLCFVFPRGQNQQEVDSSFLEKQRDAGTTGVPLAWTAETTNGKMYVHVYILLNSFP